MSRREVCGNEYDRPLSVTVGDEPAHVFDSFECAIQALAPSCTQCQCRIIGHGVQAAGRLYCYAHCARRAGEQSLRDRA